MNRPLLLVAESSGPRHASAAGLLQQAGYRIGIARTIRDAREMISDLQFIDAAPDALVTDFRFADGLGGRVIHEFRAAFPQAPVAVVASEGDLGARLWTNLPGVDVLAGHALGVDLHRWLSRVTQAVQFRKGA